MTPSSVGEVRRGRAAASRARAAQAADVNTMLKAASEEGPLAASAEHGDILGYESNPNPNPNLTLTLTLTLTR